MIEIELTLFAVLGSDDELLTVTVFGALPFPATLATIVTVAWAPLASVPTPHVTVRFAAA